MPISFENSNIKLEGFVGKPFISRGNRGFENYFINNRYIKSNIVNRAIEEGYRTFVMQHKFPFTVIYITLPANKIDVNVHPTKMEFKYDNERELFEVISNSVREALLQRDLIPPTKLDEDKKKIEKTVSSGNSVKFENVANIDNSQKAVIEEKKYTESQNKVTNATNAYKNFTNAPAKSEDNENNENIENNENKITKVTEQISSEKVKSYAPSYKILNSLKEADPDEPIYNLLNDKGVSYNSSEDASVSSKEEQAK